MRVSADGPAGAAGTGEAAGSDGAAVGAAVGALGGAGDCVGAGAVADAGATGAAGVTADALGVTAGEVAGLAGAVGDVCAKAGPKAARFAPARLAPSKKTETGSLRAMSSCSVIPRSITRYYKHALAGAPALPGYCTASPCCE